MQWQKLSVGIEDGLSEEFVVLNGITVLGIDVRDFLPDFLTIPCSFVNHGVRFLDLRDDGRDDAKPPALRQLFERGFMRGEVVRFSPSSNDGATAFKCSELKISNFSGNRMDEWC